MLPLSSTSPPRDGKLFQILLCLFLVNSINVCYAQSWETQLESYGNLSSVYFADSNTGWVVGSSTILKTENGGETWIKQSELGGTSVHFIDNQTGWIVGSGGVILKTQDGGETWFEQSSGTDIDLNDVHFTDNNTGWAVGNSFDISTNSYFGTILKTEDGGKTWIEQTFRPNIFISDVHFVDSQTGWIVGRSYHEVEGWGGTMLKTQDGGKTWTEQLSVTDNWFTSVYFIDNQTGWVVGSSGIIFKTTNGGESWAEQTFETFRTLSNIHFIDHQTGWLVSGGGGTNGGSILKTQDGGETWVEQIPWIELYGVYFIDHQTGWLVSDGPAESDGSILKTQDGGETWIEQSSGAWFKSVHFIDSLTGWVVGESFSEADKILKTEDGGKTWIRQISGSGIIEARFYSVHFIDRLTGWVVGECYSQVDGGGCILKTEDGGKTWTKQLTINTYLFTSVYFVDSHTGWAVGSGGSIFKTTNGGETWTEPTTQVNYYLSSVHFTDSNTGWIVGFDGIILKTTNGGETWFAQPSGTDSHLSSVYFVDSQTGWAVGGGGTILYTRNGGETWTEQASRLSIHLSSVHFVDHQIGWVTGYETLLKTEDGGNTWIKQPSGRDSNLSSVYFVDSQTGWAVGSGGTILHYSSQEDTTGNENNQQRVNEFIVQYAQDASEEEIQDFEQVLRDSGAVLVKECNECSSSSIQLWYSEDIIDLDTRLKYARDRSDVDTLEYNYEIDFQPWEAGKVKFWQPQASLTNTSLTSVHFVDSLTGWAIGYGTILHTEDGGETWVEQLTVTAGYLESVFFVDSLTGWVVGFIYSDYIDVNEGGTILKTQDGGKTWTEQIPEIAEWLWPESVYFVDRQTGWVVGHSDYQTDQILKTEDGGETWFEQSELGGSIVQFIDRNTGWVVSYSTILKTQDGGETWIEQLSGTEGSSMHFIDSQTGWILGLREGAGWIILHTSDGGATWIEKASGIGGPSMHFIDSLTGWISGWTVGSGGTILKTIDGGATWLPQASGTDDALADVFFIDSNTGWVVGANGTILVSHQQDALVQPYAPHNVIDTVRVAVVDTGVETHHHLLQNALGFTGSDDDGSCYMNGYGYDYIRSSADPKDIDGHGTGVNGVIVRDFPDSIKLELMNLKFYEGEGAIFDAVCGIYHAIVVEADIINLSWGFKSESYPGILYDALKVAQDSGILVITSAGNTSENNDVVQKYPANLELDNIITVTAYEEHDGSKQLASYANYGQNTVDVAAEGYLQTAASNGEISEVSGTSMAAPLVTRTAAIIKGEYPKLTYQQVRDCIFSTTDVLLTPVGKSIKYGALNHQAALACAEEKAHGTGLVATVQNFTLLNAASDQEVLILEQGATFSLDTLHLSSYSVLAHVEGEAITRVIMQLEGAQETLQTERIAPYTLFGNKANDYFGRRPKAGDYTLTATPYYLDQDSVEVAGQSLAINFSVADSSTSPNARVAQEASKDVSSASASFHSEMASTTSRIYPNPVSGELNLAWPENINEEIIVSLYNLQGIEVLHTKVQVYQKHIVMIDLSSLPTATYLIKVIAKNKVSTTLIVKTDP